MGANCDSARPRQAKPPAPPVSCLTNHCLKAQPTSPGGAGGFACRGRAWIKFPMKRILIFGLLIFAESLVAAKPGVTRLSIYPEHSALRGSKAGQALLVTANFENGEERDVTHQSTFRVLPEST